MTNNLRTLEGSTARIINISQESDGAGKALNKFKELNEKNGFGATPLMVSISNAKGGAEALAKIATATIEQGETRSLQDMVAAAYRFIGNVTVGSDIYNIRVKAVFDYLLTCDDVWQNFAYQTIRKERTASTPSGDLVWRNHIHSDDVEEIMIFGHRRANGGISKAA